jgi:hypothetical protein
MLIWVAREKSPIGSEEAMPQVWYLSQGEIEAPAGALLLPVRQPAVFEVYPERPAGNGSALTEKQEPG